MRYVDGDEIPSEETDGIVVPGSYVYVSATPDEDHMQPGIEMPLVPMNEGGHNHDLDYDDAYAALEDAWDDSELFADAEECIEPCEGGDLCFHPYPCQLDADGLIIDDEWDEGALIEELPLLGAGAGVWREPPVVVCPRARRGVRMSGSDCGA